MAYVNQKEYDAAVETLRLRDNLYEGGRLGEFAIGDRIDAVLHNDARSYTMKTHEWPIAWNLYNQGKSPLQIAEHICAQRGFDIHKRMRLK